MQKLGIILLLVIVGACTKSDFCIEPNSATMGLAFKTYDSTNALVDTALQNVDVYSTDTTTSLVENIASLTRINVFPNRKITGQTYVIFNSNNRDTVSVTYTPEENFISNGCGYQFFFRIENVSFSKTNIDSVNIIDALVTDDPNTINLEIIYK